MRWHWLIFILFGLLGSQLAHAATLIIAGRSQEASLLAEEADVLAPLVPSLRLIGAQATLKPQSVRIRAANEKSLTLTAGSRKLIADDQTVTLPVAPRLVGGEWYLPVRALAPWLNVEVHYTPEPETLTVLPRVNIAYDQREGVLAVLISSAAPLAYTSGRTTTPARAYFDFKNVSVGTAEQTIPVTHPLVQRLRYAQFSSDPPVVRVVADLTDAARITPQVEDEGRRVVILIETPAPDALPPVVDPTVPSAPATLFNLALAPLSAQQSELSIEADKPIELSASYQAAKRQLTLRFANGVNGVPAGVIAAARDRIVEKVEVTGNDTGATVTITLKGEHGYLISREAQAVRVLLGTFHINDMVIVLDPGHGGGQPGAVGAGGLMEKIVNLDVALRAEKLLKDTGARVLLTRRDDSTCTLPSRTALAHANKAAVFVSIHCNSSATPDSCSGSQTYYMTQQSATLAQTMHPELVKGLGLKNGGIRIGNFYVVRECRVPSVLLELAYLNNKAEEKLLGTPEFRQKAAVAIVNGLRRYAATKAWQQRRTDLSPIVAAQEVTAPGP